MNTKLTLRLNKDTIYKIKTYAMKHDKSVSSITENLYKTLIIKENGQDTGLTPIAKKYRGIIKKRKIDIDNLKLNFLKEKHLK